MNIVEYKDTYKEDVKKLLKELQEYVVSLDLYNYNILNEGYEEKCFNVDYEEVVNNNGKIFLAIEDNNVIGMIMGIIIKPIIDYDYIRKTNKGEITELIVTKTTRSKGVGKELLLKMENYFKEKDCKVIDIDVFGYNDIAKNFYTKNGYHTRMMTVSKKID